MALDGVNGAETVDRCWMSIGGNIYGMGGGGYQLGTKIIQ